MNDLIALGVEQAPVRLVGVKPGTGMLADITAHGPTRIAPSTQAACPQRMMDAWGIGVVMCLGGRGFVMAGVVSADVCRCVPGGGSGP
jgi:hypothetical protein